MWQSVNMWQFITTLAGSQETIRLEILKGIVAWFVHEMRLRSDLASSDFLESPFALRKQRIPNFLGANGDTYFPLDAYTSGGRK